MQLCMGQIIIKNIEKKNREKIKGNMSKFPA